MKWYKRVQWWLALGLIGWLASALPGISSTFSSPFALALEASIDWLASCVLYFFYAALIGWAIDYYVQNVRAQDWVWFTAGFLALGVGVAVLFFRFDQGFMPLLFPVAYGLFFTSEAYTVLFPKLVVLEYGKLVLNILFLSVFGLWLYVQLREQRRVVLRRALLVVLFAIFFVGLVSCAQQLG